MPRKTQPPDSPFVKGDNVGITCNSLAGSILQIEPKCFDSGYKLAGKVIPLEFNLMFWNFKQSVPHP